VSLNIKDPETLRLAQALAQATGESMTRAVHEALRERLQRVQLIYRPSVKADDLLAIGRRCAKLRSGARSDPGRLLHGGRGLPR
jgi:antitoxin VapB